MGKDKGGGVPRNTYYRHKPTLPLDDYKRVHNRPAYTPGHNKWHNSRNSVVAWTVFMVATVVITSQQPFWAVLSVTEQRTVKAVWAGGAGKGGRCLKTNGKDIALHCCLVC